MLQHLKIDYRETDSATWIYPCIIYFLYQNNSINTWIITPQDNFSYNR